MINKAHSGPSTLSQPVENVEVSEDTSTEKPGEPRKRRTRLPADTPAAAIPRNGVQPHTTTPTVPTPHTGRTATDAPTASPASPASASEISVVAQATADPIVRTEPDFQLQTNEKRRMPQSIRPYLIKVQGGKWYLPVNMRLVWFRDNEETRNWGVGVKLLEGGHEAGFATVQAFIYNENDRLIASDVKTETKQDFPAGWVEKASTGAIGRALALTGFGTQFDDTYFDYDHNGHVTEAPIKGRPQGQQQGQRPGSNARPGAPAAPPAQKAPAAAPAPAAQAAPTAQDTPVDAKPKPTPLEKLQSKIRRVARERGVRVADLATTYAPEITAWTAVGTSALTERDLSTVLARIAHADAAANVVAVPDG